MVVSHEVEQLKTRISQNGYDENFPLVVGFIGDSDQAEVLGGSHRFTACAELGLVDVPANVYRGVTPDEAIAISYKNNQNQKTFVPETFLDLAHQVYNLKQEGKTLEAIGRIFGKTKQYAGYHFDIIGKLADSVLDIVESTLSTQKFDIVDNDEKPNVDTKSTRVDGIHWKLGWFRHITPLSHKHQRQIVDKIIANAKNVTTKMITGIPSVSMRLTRAGR